MFYLEPAQMEVALRFGDVIQGFPICFPVIEDPSLKATYHIKVTAPAYAVVLSPCCSISDKVLAIAPLQQLDGKIFRNPFFAEDPARINTRIPAEKSLPVDAWEKLPAEEKAKRLSKGEAFVCVDLFVYAPHALLPEYMVNRKDGNILTKYYVVDFRTAIRIGCDKIVKGGVSPGACKVLQLSVETRELLRKKIGSYYQRVPAEDEAALVS